MAVADSIPWGGRSTSQKRGKKCSWPAMVGSLRQLYLASNHMKSLEIIHAYPFLSIGETILGLKKKSSKSPSDSH
jgi:hypothetical protein